MNIAKFRRSCLYPSSISFQRSFFFIDLGGIGKTEDFTGIYILLDEIFSVVNVILPVRASKFFSNTFIYELPPISFLNRVYAV